MPLFTGVSGWGTHGESKLGFPTFQSLYTSAFREICGEWGIQSVLYIQTSVTLNKLNGNELRVTVNLFCIQNLRYVSKMPKLNHLASPIA